MTLIVWATKTVALQLEYWRHGWGQQDRDDDFKGMRAAVNASSLESECGGTCFGFETENTCIQVKK
jgi:hypothetical protein